MNRNDLARFFGSVRVSPTGCWEWTGSLNIPNGYGRFYRRINGVGRLRLAHRVSYETFVGPIPAGLEMDHLCRNKPCCNPAHLEPVTRSENIRRFVATVTHCPKGHPRTPENIKRVWAHPNNQTIDGKQNVCRICQRDYHREWEKRRPKRDRTLERLRRIERVRMSQEKSA